MSLALGWADRREIMSDLFAKLSTILLCVFIVSVSSCTAYTNKINADATIEAVKLGADPMEFQCGLSSSSVTEKFCLVVASRK